MKNAVFYVVAFILAVAIIGGFVLGGRHLKAVLVQNQIIHPVKGVECVVVSASDSTSVACWKTTTIEPKGGE